MREQHPEADFAAMFKALGDPTRLRIFAFLRDCAGPVAVEKTGAIRRVDGPTVGEICCRITGIERITSTISHHIKELRLAGLVDVERRGKNIVCAVNRDAVRALGGYMREDDPGGGLDHDREGEIMASDDKGLMRREDIRSFVRERYGAAARIVLEGRGEACCSGGNVGTGKASSSCCSPGTKDAITSDLYSAVDAAEIPEAALLASLGCGNPTALAALRPGEVVLDLGSGGGIDVLLSAKRVGPSGFAYGLDMTDEMLALAEKNREEAGVTNVKFLKGHIEDVPLPDDSVDVLISNCVINLSADKDAVLREAFRVLRPGGRFAVSDVVLDGALPDAIRRDMEAYAGCVAGALERSDYLERLAQAGFVEASVEPTRRYSLADIENSIAAADHLARLSPEERAGLDGRVMSAFIRATKPDRGGGSGA